MQLPNSLESCGLDAPQSEQIRQAFTSRRYRPDEVVFREGETSETFCFIKSGQVLISKRNQNGDDEPLGVLKEGQFFGEIGLLEQMERTATVKALVDLEAVLSDLGGRGVTDVLVEGGATVLKAFVKEQLADKVMVYIAPIVIGGGEKMPRIDFTNGILPERLQEVRVQNLEGDILLEGYLRFYPG